ncbi:hypothetical protein BT96DRAFT_887956, partial [Gymnopus androsaceus JB14]
MTRGTTLKDLGGLTAVQVVVQTASAAAGALPPLATALSILGAILELVQKFQSNKKEWKDFTAQITHNIAFIKSISEYDEKELPPNVLDAIYDLKIVLERTQDSIAEVNARGSIKGILNIKSDPESIKKHMDAIATATENLKLQAHMSELIGIHNIKEQQDEYFSRKAVEDVTDWLRQCICGTDPRSTYSDILSRRKGDASGKWLLEHEKFVHWLSHAERTLWCPGMPGAGKTMLATIIMEHLFKLHSHDLKKTGLACIYLSYQERIHDIREPLISILLQLIKGKRSLSVGVEEGYKSSRNGQIQPSIPQTLDMLKSEVFNFDETYIIVDALDECQHSLMVALITHLENLRPKIHLLTTSRIIAPIQNFMNQAEKLDIQAQEVDIRAFFSTQLNDPESHRLKKLLKKERGLRREIEETIIQTAKGMFLLARLHTEALANALNINEIRASLKTLPTTIDDAYDLAIQRIIRQPHENHRSFALKVLTWVAYSERLLTVHELLHALAIEPGDSHFDINKIPLVEDITGLCAGLIIVNSITQVVQLVHPSMKAYFSSIRAKGDQEFMPIASNMALICLTCLSFAIQSNEISDHELAKRSDSDDKWGNNDSDADFTADDSDDNGYYSAIDTLHSNTDWSSSGHSEMDDKGSWRDPSLQEIRDSFDEKAADNNRSESEEAFSLGNVEGFWPESNHECLQTSSSLQKIQDSLYEQSDNDSSHCHHISNPFSEHPSSQGSEIRSISFRSANRTSSSLGGRSQSSSSSHSGSSFLDSSTVAHSLDIYAAQYWGVHALLISPQCPEMHTKTMEFATALLLKRGFINQLIRAMYYKWEIYSTSYATALHIAVYFGLSDLAEMLLSKGCDINAADGAGNTVLMTAIQQGHEYMVDLLIKYGARIDLH